MSIACVVIAAAHRHALVRERVLPSVLTQGFDEVVVVGQYEPGEGYEYFHVPPLTGTTVDALVKRDVGTIVTLSEVVIYLCDDHCFSNGQSAIALAAASASLQWDVIVPSRWADHPERGRIRINNGEAEQYCGGHCGVFRRHVLRALPWAAMPHHRLWDLLASREQQRMGFTFLSAPDLAVLDLEPEARPWL